MGPGSEPRTRWRPGLGEFHSSRFHAGNNEKAPHKAGPKVSGWHPCGAGDLSTLSRASSLVYGIAVSWLSIPARAGRLKGGIIRLDRLPILTGGGRGDARLSGQARRAA